jgi:hypothetical protein
MKKYLECRTDLDIKIKPYIFFYESLPLRGSGVRRLDKRSLLLPINILRHISYT